MNVKYAFVISVLLLPLHVQAKDYKGGELRTIQSYRYGRFETSIKASAGSGQLCSFFTYYDGGGVSNWNEIDIEIMGRYTDQVQCNTITPGQTNHVSQYPVFSNTQDGFHTYGFEWTPEYVAWFVDGIEAVRQTGAHIATLNKSQKIMMNIWPPASVEWAGEWDPDILPARAYYDWVSYASYTPGTGNTGTDNNFTLQWTDQFSAWSTTRWQKATHTFDNNNCDFTPQNVVFSGGYMVLCLTDNEHLGLADVNPPALLWARVLQDRIAIAFSESLDQESAETVSRYVLVPAEQMEEALLLEDKKTVQLTVADLDSAEEYHLIVYSGILDRASPPNQMRLDHCDVAPSRPLSFPFHLNVGGNAWSGYVADQAWSHEVEYGYVGGANGYFTNLPIQGTDEDEIYRSERWGLLSYKVRCPAGAYSATLMIAENYFAEPGKRVFDVFVEGNRVREDLDLYDEVGKSTAFAIHVLDIEVADAVLDIHFSASVDNPLLNGLVVAEHEECPGQAGDVNGDGFVDVIDVVTVVNHILELALLDECGQLHADVNIDGAINIIDLIEIVNIILGGGR